MYGDSHSFNSRHWISVRHRHFLSNIVHLLIISWVKIMVKLNGGGARKRRDDLGHHRYRDLSTLHRLGQVTQNLKVCLFKVVVSCPSSTSSTFWFFLLPELRFMCVLRTIRLKRNSGKKDRIWKTKAVWNCYYSFIQSWNRNSWKLGFGLFVLSTKS